MYTLLMVFFVILCFFLALFVLIQQGKGDLGLGSMGGSQMLFGGSGGQGFFEKATWIMGAIFMFGALGLAILKSKEHGASILEGEAIPLKQQHAPMTPPQARTEIPVQQNQDLIVNNKNIQVPKEAMATTLVGNVPAPVVPAQTEQAQQKAA